MHVVAALDDGETLLCKVGEPVRAGRKEDPGVSGEEAVGRAYRSALKVIAFPPRAPTEPAESATSAAVTGDGVKNLPAAMGGDADPAPAAPVDGNDQHTHEAPGGDEAGASGDSSSESLPGDKRASLRSDSGEGGEAGPDEAGAGLSVFGYRDDDGTVLEATLACQRFIRGWLCRRRFRALVKMVLHRNEVWLDLVLLCLLGLSVAGGGFRLVRCALLFRGRSDSQSARR